MSRLAAHFLAGIIIGMISAMGAIAEAASKDPTAYICTLDEAIGFKLSNKIWTQTTFKPESYILKRRPDQPDGKPAWALSEHGTNGNIGFCREDYRDNVTDLVEGQLDQIECNGIFKVKMDKKTLRFLFSYFAGYTTGRDNNDDTPVLGIGKCSPI